MSDSSRDKIPEYSRCINKACCMDVSDRFQLILLMLPSFVLCSIICLFFFFFKHWANSPRAAVTEESLFTHRNHIKELGNCFLTPSIAPSSAKMYLYYEREIDDQLIARQGHVTRFVCPSKTLSI